jgi:hypothetical protein
VLSSPHVFWKAVNTNDNSLRGRVGMFIRDADPSTKTMLCAVYAAYVLVIAFLGSRSGDHKEAAVIDAALLLISMLMLSLMSSESPFVAWTLATFVVAAMRKADAEPRLIARYLLILSFLLINAAARDIVGMVLTIWAKDHRLLVIDALLFLVPFALLVLRTHPTTQPRQRS